MREGLLLLALPSFDHGVSGFIFWAAVVPAVILAATLFLVARISSCINKRAKIEKGRLTDGSCRADGNEGK